jgi:PAS domain S-box-containing protein
VADLYRALFERSTRPMWVCDRTTLAIRIANDAACRLYGWTREELCAMTLAQLWDPDDAGAIASTIPRLARHITRGGAVIRVELDTIEVEHDGTPAAIITATEITATWMQRFAIEKSVEGMAVIDCDPDYTLRYLSPGAERLLRRPAAELVGKPSMLIAHPDDVRGIALAPPGESFEHVTRVQLPDGSWRWLATLATDLRNEPGIRAIVTNFRDVTRRVEAEHALHDANRRLEFLLSASSAVTYSAAPVGGFTATYISANVRDMLGWSAAEYGAPRFWRDHLHPDDRDAVETHVAQLFATGSDTFEYRFAHADGGYRWLFDCVRLVRDADGTPREIVGHFTDVSERHHAEESLRRSEANFRTLIERSPTVTIVHVDGVIAYVNPAACALLDYDASEMIGRHILDCVPPDDHAIALASLASTARGGHTRTGPLRIRRRDGRYVTVDGEALRLAFDGKPAHVVLARDVTERSELFTRMAVADRMVSVGTLAAGVAHEINNPLAFVVSNLALIADDLPRLLAGEPTRLGRADVEQLLVDAREGAARVSAIVRDLRALARPDDITTAAVDVAKVLASSIRMTANELRHRARVIEHIEQAPLVEANESRLGQVFLNLLVNAAQAIPEGRAAQNEVRVRLGANADGTSAIVEIEDTGIGIPSHVIGRIFDPFFTTKPVGVGVGLGLAISHQIITSLGGDIAVTSTPGQGASFRITLPAAGATRGDAVANLPERAAEASATRVLMIDDEAAVGRSTRALLAPDYEITTVTRAADGLRLLAHGGYDAILCDLMMPEMTGMEFWQRLEPALARRVVFLTGGAFTEQARAFLAQVTQPRVEKPFREHELRRAIEQVRAISAAPSGR